MERVVRREVNNYKKFNMYDNLFDATIATISAILIGFILFLPLVPLMAIFFLWLWNNIMSYWHLPHNMITYWQSIKLCFLIYVIKGLLNTRVNFSRNER